MLYAYSCVESFIKILIDDTSTPFTCNMRARQKCSSVACDLALDDYCIIVYNMF